MASNRFNVISNTPDLISWAQAVNARNDAKAKQSRENLMNTMKVLGLAAAAYKGANTPAITPEQMNQFETQAALDWDTYEPSTKLQLMNAGYMPIGRPMIGSDWNSTNIWSD